MKEVAYHETGSSELAFQGALDRDLGMGINCTDISVDSLEEDELSQGETVE